MVNRNEAYARTLTKRRIQEVIKEDSELRNKLAQELGIALTGTVPPPYCTKFLKNTQGIVFPASIAHAEITRYRIIYSTPDLKAEFEHHAGGSLGSTPPLMPEVISRAFNARERSIALSTLPYPIATMLMFGLVCFFFTPFALFKVLGTDPQLFLGLICTAIVLYCSILRLEGRNRNRQLKGWSECCECQMSTNNIHSQGDGEGEALACSNCRGTAVCRVGCKNCCPFVIPKQDAVRRQNIKMALKANSVLEKKFERKFGDCIIRFAGEGKALTPQARNRLLWELFDNESALCAEIETAMAASFSENDHRKDVQATALPVDAVAVEDTSLTTMPVEMELPVVQAYAVESDEYATVWMQEEDAAGHDNIV